MRTIHETLYLFRQMLNRREENYINEHEIFPYRLITLYCSSCLGKLVSITGPSYPTATVYSSPPHGPVYGPQCLWQSPCLLLPSGDCFCAYILYILSRLLQISCFTLISLVSTIRSTPFLFTMHGTLRQHPLMPYWPFSWVETVSTLFSFLAIASTILRAASATP